MRKIILLSAFFVLTFGFNLIAQNKASVVGNWKYEVPQAPYGYEKGNINFSEKENVLSGDLVFNSGYSVTLNNVTLKNDTLSANVYVEGERVSIVAKVLKNTLNGTVDTSMGKMNLKAEKVETDKKK